MDKEKVSSKPRRKRARPEDPVNIDRWLVSYADFITLLFTFFVMMYAVSALNEGKYRTISHAIVATFLHRTLRQRPHAVVSPNRNRSGLQARVPPVLLRQSLQLLQKESPSSGNMAVVESARSIRLRIAAGALFRKGHAGIRIGIRPFLLKLARLLSREHRPFRVEGHTDNLPIHGRYPNNWALSGARAVNVLSFLLKSAPIDPRLSSAVAFGATRPVVPNDTPEHRRQNRRVEVVILKPTAPVSHSPVMGLSVPMI